MSEFKITGPGKYISRSGLKIIIERQEDDGTWTGYFHRYLQTDRWTSEGNFVYLYPCPKGDIVGPWVEPDHVADESKMAERESVNHPQHYNDHPSGIECIEIVRHMGFNLGNAIKYIWRADLKNDAIEDLRKAVFYINDEISKREKAK